MVLGVEQLRQSLGLACHLHGVRTQDIRAGVCECPGDIAPSVGHSASSMYTTGGTGLLVLTGVDWPCRCDGRSLASRNRRECGAFTPPPPREIRTEPRWPLASHRLAFARQGFWPEPRLELTVPSSICKADRRTTSPRTALGEQLMYSSEIPSPVHGSRPGRNFSMAE